MSMDARTSNRAMISVIERARGRQGHAQPSRFLSIALLAVFFIALMSGLAAGASAYRSVVAAQTEANELHLHSGLIANTIRSNDITGAISRGEGPEGPALILSRELAIGTYETRLYAYEGQVVEEFVMAGRPYNPEMASPVLKTSTFDFSLEDDVVRFTTDAGTFSVALRADGVVSRGGGA